MIHIGIDLGGTKIEIVGLDGDANEVFKKRIASPQGDYQASLSALVRLITDAENALGGEFTVGLGIPGSLSPDNSKVKNANSTWLIGHDLKSDLQNAIRRDVVIANDADCFVLSESIDGNAAGSTTAFGIILGTGVGGGLVINQQIVSGPNSITGEWGHNPMPWSTSFDPKHPCYCGKQGCIETFLSGPGMIQHYHQYQSKYTPENVQAFLTHFRQGDSASIEYFSLYLSRLGRALASVINVIDPDVIVFGGGLSNIREIYPRIGEQVAHYVFSDQLNTRFVEARHGDASGVRGAAWLGAQIKVIS